MIHLHFGKSSYLEFVRGRFQKKMKDLKEYSSEVEGLSVLLNEIYDLNDSDLLKKLINAYSPKGQRYSKGVFRDDFFNSHLMILAKKNLKPPLMPHISPRLVFLRLANDYKFFEYFYFINTENPLSLEDMGNIYYGGLGERVMLLLDKFDEPEIAPSIDDKFFKVLIEVKWQRKSKKLFNKLIVIFGELANNIDTLSLFRSANNLFINLLCFCSAASDNRTLVSEEDVVRAFKTYIKLMKTDVTQYKAKTELIEPNGYRVCNKCGSYYELLPGESPDDFTDTCECGGKLEYYENADYTENFNDSPLYRFLKMDNPKLVLRLWGLGFIVIGLLSIYGYYTHVKFPLLLPISIFSIISGLLPFIFIHKAINIYYSIILISLGIFSFAIGAFLPGVTFSVLSIIMFQNARKIK